MKRITKGISVSLVLILLLASCLVGCGSSKTSLVEHGMEVIGLMSEIVRSDDYLALVSGSTGITDLVKLAASGDYSTPRAVYAITLDDAMFFLLGETSDGQPQLSQTLQGVVKQRSYAALASLLNAEGGAQVLAASTVATAGKVFVDKSLKRDVLYLYVFDNAAPVLVSFLPGEDGAVSASGSFVLSDSLPLGSFEELTAFFLPIGATVEQVV